MPQYNRTEIDLSTRIALGIEMLTPIPERSWDRVTALAEAHGVSRPFLYELRDRAFEALCAALAPRSPGRRTWRCQFPPVMGPPGFRPRWSTFRDGPKRDPGRESGGPPQYGSPGRLAMPLLFHAPAAAAYLAVVPVGAVGGRDHDRPNPPAPFPKRPNPPSPFPAREGGAS